MKKSSIIILVTICFVGFVLINCNSSTKNVIKEDVTDTYIKKEVINSDKEIAFAQKEIYSDFQKFIKEANLKINKNLRTIIDLKVASVAEGKITNETFYSKVEELEKNNNEIKAELDNYIANGSGNWKEFKGDFDTNLHEFDIAINQVKVVWQN